MEKKTIGGFIATLRKANGMTQKELAERLNVSDKTVSRWERDDGAPDLAVIPVIAEIFGVTCDELLRGERKSQAERDITAEENEPTAKGEKQRQRLLAVSLSKYQVRTFISMGISLIGLIVAMIGNLGFLRAYIGFFIGAVFYLAAVICQAIFVNQAFLSVADESLTDIVKGQFKNSVIRLAEYSIGLTVVLFGFSLPLIAFPYDTYVGLDAEVWFLYGMIFGIVALLIISAVGYFLNEALIKRGICVLNEKAAVIYQQNHVLKRRCALILAGVVFITFIEHMAANTIWGPWSIMEGIRFDDYESFVAYMEQDIPYRYQEEHRYGISTVEFSEISSTHEPVEETIYYDVLGNEISEEQALGRTIEDSNGNVLCEYVERNEMVCSIHYSQKDGNVLPITVCTFDDLREAQGKVAVRNMIFGIGYCVEIVVVLGVYLKKRAR